MFHRLIAFWAIAFTTAPTYNVGAFIVGCWLIEDADVAFAGSVWMIGMIASSVVLWAYHRTQSTVAHYVGAVIASWVVLWTPIYLAAVAVTTYAGVAQR